MAIRRTHVHLKTAMRPQKLTPQLEQKGRDLFSQSGDGATPKIVNQSLKVGLKILDRADQFFAFDLGRAAPDLPHVPRWTPQGQRLQKSGTSSANSAKNS
ncbi:MAG: hypothetical protein AAFV29_17730, partial [Myxococcota bacterium]